MNFDEPKWDTWKSQFMTFRLVTKLHNEENVVQIASLKYCMGGEAEAIMKTFNLTDGQRNNFEQPSEKKECYLRTLYTASEDCEFGALKRERIRNQFIAGLRDERLAEKLEHLYMSNSGDFTLDRVIENTRTYCNIKVGRQQEKEKQSYECVDVTSHSKTMRAKTEGSCGYCGMTH